MDPRRVRDALADYIPARVLEPAFTLATVAGYAARFRGLGAIRANQRLRGVHRGKRCFVLGTGPSLARQNLQRLRGEHVYTVNSFVDHANTLGVDPTGHVLMDPFYFEENTTGIETLRRVGAMPAGTLRIFPLHYKRIVDRYVDDPTYVLFAGDFAGNSNADLSRALPSLYSVTNLALLAALYAGFSKIYLLGCEMDMLSRVESVQPLLIRESHYYNDDVAMADFTRLGFDYTRYAHAVLRMFDGFRFAAKACGPDQAIYNATLGGVLDVFPRVSLDDVI